MLVTDKRDYLHVCNELAVPTQDFEMQFCVRCLQAECSRSQHGKSRFESRISSWKERLFTNVPRMDASDVRLGSIQAKKFVDIDAGPIPEIGSRGTGAWIDPRLDLPKETPQDVPETTLAQEAAPSKSEPLKPLEPPAPPATPPRPVPQLMNTPFQQGQMIGGRKPDVAPTDSWEMKPQETRGLPIVKTGARIKLGGSGV